MSVRIRTGGILLASVFALSACSGAGATAAPGGPTSPPAGVGASQAADAPASTTGNATGKSLDSFDPCSVVSDSDFAAAISGESSEPSDGTTITATHVAVDGANTGLPGAKACSQTWTTTDSSGRISQGGEPVIVTFDLYSNLAEIQSGSPILDDYAASGAQAFEAPGDAGVPHLTKDGYLFRMSGNSDTALLKVIALGIASRL